MSLNNIQENYEVIVAGGGVSGMCAALACARKGIKTAIIQNRPMFGGNASSEIRMHILGASCHSSKPNMRETGIIEEIQLDNKRINKYTSFHQFDVVMWEKMRFQKNLTVYLNTNADDIIMENGKIAGIVCHQISTETEIKLFGNIFIDATGNGTIGAMAGAVYRVGSESKKEFNEPTAPDEENDYTMGCTLRFSSVDRHEPVKFEKPEWAYTYTEEDLKDRGHADEKFVYSDGGGRKKEGSADEAVLPDYSGVDEGYWWCELGGDYKDIIGENEDIRDELIKSMYGIWDHLKNQNDHGMENYDLDWVELVPGYRESRRLIGDYLLNENDIRSNRIFDDAVAYGGWPMDVHVPGGIKDLKGYPSHVYSYNGCYTIPFRSYYSVNIPNLMMAGRDISCTKLGISSTRVMGTCAVGGQAVGTAAYLAIKYNCFPKEIGQKHINELQQELLKDDCFIPGFKNTDAKDKARKAKVFATSELEGYEAVNVINGIARPTKEDSNCWQSAKIGKEGEILSLSFDKEEEISQVRITFDSDLNKDLCPSMTRLIREKQEMHLPSTMVKDFCVELLNKGQLIEQKVVSNNRYRLNVLDFVPVLCDEVKIKLLSTYGVENARVFEVRIY